MLQYKHIIRLRRRLPSWGPFAVLREYKNRDGPLIYHKRDGPQWYRFIGIKYAGTGARDGTGPPTGKCLVYSRFATQKHCLVVKPEFKNVVKFEEEYLS